MILTASTGTETGSGVNEHRARLAPTTSTHDDARMR